MFEKFINCNKNKISEPHDLRTALKFKGSIFYKYYYVLPKPSMKIQLRSYSIEKYLNKFSITYAVYYIILACIGIKYYK